MIKKFYIDNTSHTAAKEYIKRFNDNDNDLLVARKEALRATNLNGLSMAIMQQIHTDIAVFVDKPFALNEEPKADGLVTTTPGIALAIQTADCCPILLHDDENNVIGALHAGWKGAKAGIIKSTIGLMLEKGAKLANIKAEIGPTIQQTSYEVGPEFYQGFINDSAQNSSYFIPSLKTGHYMFDLPGYCYDRLKTLGIRHIYNTALDTYSNAERFPSYRRSCHQAKKLDSCLLSMIVITPN